MDTQKCVYLIHFSHIIESTCEKYPQFQEQVECREADIFMSIPALILLKSLENEDKNIGQFFLPEMYQDSTKLH